MPGHTTFDNSPATIAVAYGRIAKGLRRLGEVSLALNVCEKGLQRYPNNSAIYITKGEIQIACYNQDNKSDHLKEALTNFGKALQLDPQNYLAKLLASQIYLKAGAKEQAKTLLAAILKTSPNDKKANAMMTLIEEREKEKAKTENKEAKTKQTAKDKAADDIPRKKGESLLDHTVADQWELDEKMDIGEDEEPIDEIIFEALSAKLSIFSRLEGLFAIFIIDKNGQPLKIINKKNIDENIIPSFIFNLQKTSAEGIRRSGLGSFHQGVLVSPIGTIFLVATPHAIIAIIVDNDTNMATVEKRIQRYLEEVKD